MSKKAHNFEAKDIVAGKPEIGSPSLQQQPRGLGHELIIQAPEPIELMIKPIHFALQQLGDRKRAAKLGLIPLDMRDSEIIVDDSGIALEPKQAKVIEALQVAYHLTGYDENGSYRGHFIQTTKARTDSYMPIGTNIEVPGLFISEPELLELAGYVRGSNNRFRSRDKKAIRDILEELRTKAHSIYFIMKEGKGKDKEEKVVEVETSLLSVTKIKFHDGIAEAKEGADPRATWYQIVPHHIFVNQMGTFSFLQDVRLMRQIENAKVKLKGTNLGRPTDHERLFIQYLLTLDREFPITRETLANKLRLGYLVRQKKAKLMEEKIQEAIDVALELDILTGYEMVEIEPGKVKYYFSINPNKSSRYQRKLEKGQKKPEM